MSTADVRSALALPPDERGAALLSIDEDQWFDRKSCRIKPRDLADAAIALANAEGGHLVIGLSDGRVEGVDAAGKAAENAWRQATLDFAVPPLRSGFESLRCRDASGRPNHLFVVTIAPSTRVHCNTRDEVLLRVGDENRRLTFTQRQELIYEKGHASFEVNPVARLGEEPISQDLLEGYARAVGHPDATRLLHARGLVTRSDELTVAGLLLFGEHPQRVLPESFVRVLRYRGRERGVGARQQLLEDRRFEGPIPTVLDDARLAIEGMVPTRRAMGADGRFATLGIIPRDAWLEGLVNAVIHRAYSVAGDHIRVEVFDDRIEIESPGRFPGLVDLDDPRGMVRFARNPRIARVCADLRFGQELGEGIRRIFEEMRLAGLMEPRYRQTAGTVRLMLSSEPVDVALEQRLPEGARALLRILREGGPVGTGELVEQTGTSRPTLLRRLRGLEEAGLVEWVGKSKKDPRAVWRIRSDGVR